MLLGYGRYGIDNASNRARLCQHLYLAQCELESLSVHSAHAIPDCHRFGTQPFLALPHVPSFGLPERLEAYERLG